MAVLRIHINVLSKHNKLFNDENMNTYIHTYIALVQGVRIKHMSLSQRSYASTLRSFCSKVWTTIYPINGKSGKCGCQVVSSFYIGVANPP